MNYIVEFEETLADTDGCFASVFSEAFSQFKMPFDEGKLREYLSVPLDVLFARFYIVQSRRKHMKERVNGLRREGCRVAVISGCYEMYVRSFLERFSMETDCVVGLDRMPSGILDADALRLCTDELGSDPVCFVGRGRLKAIAEELGMRTEE